MLRIEDHAFNLEWAMVFIYTKTLLISKYIIP